jgi:polysaccharide pyruvyl transferase WcaK-like protein
MNNRGAEALLKSDIHAINDIITGHVSISVSTTDIKGVKELGLPLNATLPPLIDIPYEWTDLLAKRHQFGRNTLRYKVCAMASLVRMFVQVTFVILSSVCIRFKLRPFYRPLVTRHLKESDIIVSCSDENFKEGALLLPLNIYWILTWWPMLTARTLEVLVARFFGKPIVMFPNSVGPFRTLISRFIARLALNSFSIILTRDSISYETVRSLGIRSPRLLTYDTALLFNPMFRKAPIDLSSPTIGVAAGVYSHSVSSDEVERYIVSHAEALDETIEKYGVNIVFLPHYVSGLENDDFEISERIVSKMRHKSQARIIRTKTAEEFKSLLEQADMVISSKMHPAVLATSAYIPTLCIAYDHKQLGFFESLGLSNCVISLREVTSKRLSLKIDFVWNRKEEIRVLLSGQIPVLRKNVMKAMRQAIFPFIKAK